MKSQYNFTKVKVKVVALFVRYIVTFKTIYKVLKDKDWPGSNQGSNWYCIKEFQLIRQFTSPLCFGLRQRWIPNYNRWLIKLRNDNFAFVQVVFYLILLNAESIDISI